VLYASFSLVRIAASVGLIASITFVYFRLVSVNPTTVALSYVIAILLIATRWGIAEAMTASLAGVLCFNFFFLPPVGTFTIADPQNWVALVAFLMTAIVASQLSGRARRRNIEAVGRQRDLERLYTLSRALLLLDPGTSFPTAIAKQVADTFELPSVALFDRHTDSIALGGTSDFQNIDGKLRDAARRRTTLREPSGLLVTPIELGGSSIGSLAIIGGDLTDTVLQSVVNLAAIGLERARGQEAAAMAEAARQSGELRATVLDALAHEFKTPLTSMKAAAGDLLSSSAPGERDHELVEIIHEELDRLQELVSDAVNMVRINSGDFAVHRDRHRLASIVQSTIQKLGPRLDGHVVVNAVPETVLVDADRDLLDLALRQLLDNAVKYSPPESRIEVVATGNRRTEIAVRNTGPAIPEREQAHLFEPFFRGGRARHVPGTGMGLTIVRQIAQAHGGAASVSSAPDGWTEFRMSLPRGDSIS
jgi:two-component system sensor histidine kinase KdpD